MNNYDLEAYLNGMFMNNTNTMPNNMKKISPNDNAMDNNEALYGPYEGYIKGNLFSSLYIPYKNYKPRKITPRNQYEEDLLNLNQIQFAHHELNLLLDNYPDDKEILDLFNRYRQKFLELLKNFESKYGPVTVISNDFKDIPWSWDNEPWPWEGDAN